MSIIRFSVVGFQTEKVKFKAKFVNLLEFYDLIFLETRHDKK